MNFKMFQILVLATGLLTACEETPPPTPEINDKNCRKEVIDQIKDEKIQIEFQHKCMTRTNGSKTLRGNYKSWDGKDGM